MHEMTVAHGETKATYFWVWGALLLLTAVEVVLAYKQVLQPVHMLIVLLILSVIKAGLITMYFMHLKSELPAMRWLLTISATWNGDPTKHGDLFRDAHRVVDLGVK